MDVDTVMMDFSDGDTGSFEEERPELTFHHEMIINPIDTGSFEEDKPELTFHQEMIINPIDTGSFEEDKPELTFHQEMIINPIDTGSFEEDKPELTFHQEMIINPIDTGSFEEGKPELTFHHEIIINPIVYTTKLDEMKMFRDDTTDMSVDTIINSIIKESKPKLNWKRKCTHTIYSHYSYEDLSCYINTFNRKVARIAKRNKNLLAMCKPVKVVLEDIKYTLLRTQSTDSRISKIEKKIYPFVCDRALVTYSQSRKLHSRIIYDLQHKEADMYALDKSYFIKEYTKFRIDNSNSKIFQLLKMDKNVSHISCCCWYKREQSLAMLPLAPHETLRFMRKPHKCAINLCRCCCRNKTMTSSVRPSSREPLESHSVWLNRMVEVHTSLPLSDKSRKTLLSKSMSVCPKLEKNNSSVNPVVEIQNTPFLHSTNIDFGGEYYSIGADGQIKLHLKNTKNYRQKLTYLRLKTANNIVGVICCWYKREEFAGRLLALGALPNTVNYIRSAHTSCSPTNCSCCCKPLNTGKLKLTVLNKSARHTNDLASKKVNIKIRFSREPEKPVIYRNRNNFVSFNVSLSALEAMSKRRSEPYIKDVLDLLIPESATLDKKNSSVRVFVKKTYKHNIFIECSQLNNFTTKELRMLDIIFCALNKAIIQSKDEKKTKNNRVRRHHSCFYNTIYPLLLNTQLSVTTDLRSKRFLPSLRAHLDKTRILPFPQMKNVSAWLDGGSLPEIVCRKL